jgi:hypothetical protein
MPNYIKKIGKIKIGTKPILKKKAGVLPTFFF